MAEAAPSVMTTLLPCLQELTAELGGLEASSDDEAMVTTRVVRRRVIIQVPPAQRRRTRDSVLQPVAGAERRGLHAAAWPGSSHATLLSVDAKDTARLRLRRLRPRGRCDCAVLPHVPPACVCDCADFWLEPPEHGVTCLPLCEPAVTGSGPR